MSKEVADAAIVTKIISRRKKRRKNTNARKNWVKPWFLYRAQLEIYDMLLSEYDYRNFLRMKIMRKYST